MQAHLKIGEFARLTGVTAKTILHYHKIGLLAEPERSSAGYRLYGMNELKHMRSIKRLKSLGLSLEEIKAIIGCVQEKSNREVLMSLQAELESQKTIIEDRLAKIHAMLSQEKETLVEDSEESSSFKMILDILGPEAKTEYQSTCPALYEQERKIWSIMDEMQWGVDYQDLLREVAEYFNEHPEQYLQSLQYGEQIAAIADLPVNSPVIENLARNYGAFLKSFPFWNKFLNAQFDTAAPLESLMTEMFADMLGPAQMKLVELLRPYLIPDSGGETECGDSQNDIRAGKEYSP